MSRYHVRRYLVRLVVILLTIGQVAAKACGCSSGEGPDDFASEPMGEFGTLIYDPSNGRLAFWPGSSTIRLTVVEVRSASSKFIAENANKTLFDSIFDVVSSPKLFVLDSEGMAGPNPIELGNVLPTELDPNFLIKDLRFYAVCGGWPGKLFIVPEPSSMAFVAAPLLLLLCIQRRSQIR